MRFSLLLLALLSTGCLTTASINYSDEDQCTPIGLVYEGATVSKRWTGQERFHTQCRAPESVEEHCILQRHVKAENAAASLNTEVNVKNIAIAGGYALFVVPGYLLYRHWEPDNVAKVTAFHDKWDKVTCDKDDKTADSQ